MKGNSLEEAVEVELLKERTAKGNPHRRYHPYLRTIARSIAKEKRILKAVESEKMAEAATISPESQGLGGLGRNQTDAAIHETDLFDESVPEYTYQSYRDIETRAVNLKEDSTELVFDVTSM